MDYCRNCKELHKSTDEDCATCTGEINGLTREELLPANAEAWELWGFAQTQWRTSGVGLVGLDFPAALQLAEVLDIPATPAMLQKLRALEREELRGQADRPRKEA